MGKVYLICGKICSGKSYYAKSLKEKHTAVILSTDEATYDLIANEQGEFYNIFAQRVNDYLKKKAVEICKAGANVILDGGSDFYVDEGLLNKLLSMFEVPDKAEMDVWHELRR